MAFVSNLEFDPKPVHMEFVVDKLAVGQIFLQAGLLRVSPVILIQPVLHIRISFISHLRYTVTVIGNVVTLNTSLHAAICLVTTWGSAVNFTHAPFYC
jgi:hypothetical protein